MSVEDGAEAHGGDAVGKTAVMQSSSWELSASAAILHQL